MSDLLSYLRGDLSASARIWSALTPALVILVYFLAGAGIYLLRLRRKGPYNDSEMAARGSSVLLGMGVRQFFAWIILPPWRLVRLLRLPANALTTLSVLLSMGASVAVAAGRFSLGGWLFLFGGACDYFDGRIARATGTASPAGATLDSTLDRFSDGVVLVGLSYYYRDTWVLPVVGVLMIGSFLISYIRAKGESMGVDVRVGLMQRPERVVYLGLAVALSPVLEALYDPRVEHPFHYLAVLVIVLLAVSTMVTAARRLVHTLRALGGKPSRPWTGVDRGSLARFTVSSVVATGGDFLVLVGLVELASLVPWAATFVGCVVGGAVNFTINRIWAFGVRAKMAGQMSRYVFVSLASALLNAGGVAIMMSLPAVDYRLAWAVAACSVFLFWNFPLNRDYVFRQPPDDAPPSPASPDEQDTVGGASAEGRN